jgi:D-3-phosphoglycerate dehydrogenase
MNIAIPDKVSKNAIEVLKKEGFNVHQKPGIDVNEFSSLAKDARAIVVRSYELHKMEIGANLAAIGRSGAGVNNIPIDKCNEKGVVVFNTPGANANAVKELVLCGLFLSSRKIIQGVNWTAGQKDAGEEVPKLVEKNKSQFKGGEIRGKKLGVIGLGAIGMLVANDALELGMEVIGYDPFITIENAWKLSKDVKKADTIEAAVKNSDYLTIHVPLNDKTKKSINKHIFKNMKKGMKIMNFSRDEIINTDDLIDALKDGTVSNYVTDFPNHRLLSVDNVICIPHLGASTDEAEENCAMMVTEQLVNFLKNGTICNSVNFPDCKLDRNGNKRITVVNKNVPKMIERITEVLASENANIEEMLNKSKGELAYNILDISGEISKNALDKMSKIEGVIKVRML